MKVIHRYVLSELVGPFLFSLSLLTFILFMRQLVLLFPKFAGKDLPAQVIGELLLMSLPFIIALVLPMSVLLGVIMAFGRLSADNEITAFKSLGVPAHYLMLTPLAAAALLTVGAIRFNDRVLPETNHRYKNLLVDIAYLKPTLRLEEGVVMDDFPGMSLLVNRIRRAGGKSLQPVEPTAGPESGMTVEERENRTPADLFGIIITESGENNRTILADSGVVSFLPNRRDAMLTLYHGEIQEVDPEQKGRFQRMFFDRHRIRLPDVGSVLQRGRSERYRSDRELTMGMIRDRIDARRRDIDSLVTLALAWIDSLPADDSTVVALQQACRSRPGENLGKIKRFPPELVRFPGPDRQYSRDDPRLKLSSILRELQFAQRRIASLRVEWWKKISIPVASLAFVLLGVPLGIFTRRGGAGVALSVSFGVFLFYWVFLISGETLADRMLFSPFWAMWSPNFIFLAIGLVLLFMQVRGRRSLAPPERKSLDLSRIPLLRRFSGRPESNGPREEAGR